MPRILIVLLVIFGVYVGLRYLFRLALPFLMRYWIKKMGGPGNFNPFQPNHFDPPKKEGEVTIETKPRKNKSKSQDGEYTDFEEIK